MDRVVEVREVGKVVDPDPLERPVGAEALADRLEDRRVRPDLAVAAHASLGRGYPGERARLDARVAVAAVDPESGHVVLVREGDRLLDGHALLRGVGGAGQRGEGNEQQRDDKNRPEDADA